MHALRTPRASQARHHDSCFVHATCARARASAAVLCRCVDDRRWQWTTHANLSVWFGGWKALLLQHGFAKDAPEQQPEPDGRTAEVTMPPLKRRRIMNANETHHTLDNEGDRGGSHARTYVSRKHSRSGQ